MFNKKQRVLEARLDRFEMRIRKLENTPDDLAVRLGALTTHVSHLGASLKANAETATEGQNAALRAAMGRLDALRDDLKELWSTAGSVHRRLKEIEQRFAAYEQALGDLVEKEGQS